jgi:hypothetical protein
MSSKLSQSKYLHAPGVPTSTLASGAGGGDVSGLLSASAGGVTEPPEAEAPTSGDGVAPPLPPLLEGIAGASVVVPPSPPAASAGRFVIGDPAPPPPQPAARTNKRTDRERNTWFILFLRKTVNFRKDNSLPSVVSEQGGAHVQTPQPVDFVVDRYSVGGTSYASSPGNVTREAWQFDARGDLVWYESNSNFGRHKVRVESDYVCLY